MKDYFDLKNPISINGKKVTKLEYDTSAITCDAYIDADAAATAKMAARNMTALTTMEFNPALHLYVGIEAIKAVNPEIDTMDLERLKGFDLVQVTRIGRAFITGQGQDSTPEDSDPASENTQESTTQAS